MRGWMALAVVLAVAGCGQERLTGGGGGGKVAVARLEKPGAVMLIGGGDTAALTYKRFVDQAGGAGAAVVVVPFASGAADAEGVRAGLAGAGADAVVLTGDPARRDAELALIRAARGVYVGGGLPEKLVADFKPYADAVRGAWNAGCVVGGTSAGAMVWGDRMIVKGEPEQVRSSGLDEATGGAAVRPGLGFLPGVTVDPHFTERERQYRLWLAAGETRTLGLGVDEGTIAVVTSTGELDVLGAGTVTVVRPEGAAGQPARMTILKQGDTIVLEDWQFDAR
jgi:cyanophycinase